MTPTLAHSTSSSDSSQSRKIGVFGGTFDPVHTGHLAVAECVKSELGLDVVLFVVTADQWLRSTPPVASAAARLAMVELAVEGMPGFEASDVDIVRGGPTYTVDTLSDLRARLGGSSELYLIVGADSAVTMDRWRGATMIASPTRVVVVGRPGLAFDVRSLDESHPASGAVYVEGPMIDVSATAIRGHVKAGESIVGLVSTAVANYVEKRALYR